jgi:hypothetical protein
MKRIFLTVSAAIAVIILAASFDPAYCEDEGAPSRSFGISFGCFAPNDKNYEDIYGDEREPVFSIFYDRGISDSFALGTSLMFYADDGVGVSPSLIQSTAETDMALLKAELSVIYRMIGHDDQLFVPQLKAGISGTYFNEKIEDGKRTENTYFGYHAGLAFLLLLDRLDPGYALKLKRDYSIKNTYLFIGADYSNTDDLDDNKLDLGGIEYSVGLTFRY